MRDWLGRGEGSVFSPPLVMTANLPVRRGHSQLQLDIDRQKRFAELAKLQAVRQREAEAAGKRALNEAINTLSSAQISLQEKLALIQALPKIIEEAVRPMQNIDSIRIMQVDGLNTGAAGAHSAEHMPGAPSTNLAEQAVGAALKYRAYAPVLDQLIKEVGLSGNGLDGLVRAMPPAAVPASVPAAQA